MIVLDLSEFLATVETREGAQIDQEVISARISNNG